MMMFGSEILFIDRAVGDLETITAGLRPGVEVVLLDAGRPAAGQIASALANRTDLAAVHIIAHGAPGQVSFASGAWSSASLASDAEHLNAIGRALAAWRGPAAVELRDRGARARPRLCRSVGSGLGRLGVRRHRAGRRRVRWVGHGTWARRRNRR